MRSKDMEQINHRVDSIRKAARITFDLTFNELPSSDREKIKSQLQNLTAYLHADQPECSGSDRVCG